MVPRGRCVKCPCVPKYETSNHKTKRTKAKRAGGRRYKVQVERYTGQRHGKQHTQDIYIYIYIYMSRMSRHRKRGSREDSSRDRRGKRRQRRRHE